MNVKLCVALALMGSACVSGEPTIDSAEQEVLGGFFGERVGRSGSRLTAQYLLSPDGARQFYQFWDTELDAPCNYSETPAGELRCFPEDTYSVVYADADCTQEAIQIFTKSDDFDAPTYFSVFADAETCGPMARSSAYEAYGVLEEVDAPTVYFGGPGSCYALTPPSLPEEFVSHVYSVAPVEDDTLVTGDVAHRFAGGLRLFERIIVGDDGSRSPMNGFSGSFNRSYFDWVLDTSVTAAVTARGAGYDADVVWTDGTAGQGVFYADDTCAERAAIVNGCTERTSPVVVDAKGTLDEASCRQVFSHKSTAAAIDGPLYFAAGPQCIALPPSFDPGPAFAMGDDFDAAGLVVGQAGLSAPWRRVQTIVYNNSDLSNLPIGFYDAYAGARCTPQRIQGDDYACVPQSTPGASLRYLDAECTQLIIVRSGPSSAVETQSCYDGDVVVFDVNRDEGTVSAYEPGPLVELPAPDPDATVPNAYAMTYSGCKPSSVTEAYEAVALGELDAARFHLTDF